MGNIYKVPEEEERKKLREAVEKIQDYELGPLFRKLAKIWLFVLFVISSFLFTVISTVKISLFIWP